jgi:hypothetical protein
MLDAAVAVVVVVAVVDELGALPNPDPYPCCMYKSRKSPLKYCISGFPSKGNERQ